MAPLIPARKNTHPLGGGRPPRPDRDCADAIFFVLRTGCQWEALDATGICPHSTAHDRFQEWVEAGVWIKLWQVLLEEYDELEGLDWSYLSVDGSMTKAPLATVGERASDAPNSSARSRREATGSTAMIRPAPSARAAAIAARPTLPMPWITIPAPRRGRRVFRIVPAPV